MSRQIVLDVETTGLEPELGHRIIEIGCIELNSRRPTGRTFHEYLEPDRDIDAGAREVHGISREDLRGKPRFKDVVQDLLDFLLGAELIIHNAPFDVGFLDHELKLADPGLGTIGDRCLIVDTLVMARQLHPGQRNSLDALCKRYNVDNSQRTMHGALLDAEILSDVYLAMTGGQDSLWGEDTLLAPVAHPQQHASPLPVTRKGRVIHADADELAAHRAQLEAIDSVAADGCLWLKEISAD